MMGIMNTKELKRKVKIKKRFSLKIQIQVLTWDSEIGSHSGFKKVLTRDSKIGSRSGF